MKKILALSLILCLLSCGCAGKEAVNATKLSFKEALQYDYLKSLDGATVTINGYLATSSPVDGSFIFLMNMPYQSCPFCVPNTNQLANTIEVYPQKGKTFSYTNQAVKVTGKLEVASEGELFQDTYGYEFSFKIVDGTFQVLKDEDMSQQLQLWQKFSATDLVQQIDKMYQYVNFLCAWNTYAVNSYTDANGKTWPGYYLYDTDAQALLAEGGQYHYGSKDGYFDDLIADIQAVDPNAFAALVENIQQAEVLAKDAQTALDTKDYTSKEMYVERFQNTDRVYTLNRGTEFTARFNSLYAAFSQWLASWEL